MNDQLATATADVNVGYAAFRAPKRVSVAEGAAENYFIKQPGGYTGPWSASETPYMVEPMNMMASREKEAVCFVGPARTGKALCLETPIPTPSGWTTIGALKVGDIILGADGKPTEVVFTTEVQHNRPCYRVTFCDGESLVADDDHNWGVERKYQHAPSWRYEVKTTGEMLHDLKWRSQRRYRVRNTKPVQFCGAAPEIEPYVFGLWLGNGSAERGSLSCHEDDVDHYIQNVELAGYAASAKRHGPNAFRVYVDRGVKGVKGADNSFVAQLKRAGVYGNKHIPAEYLLASLTHRIELLRGLMDSDGTSSATTRSCATFSTTSRALRDGFVELARSLGLAPKVTHHVRSENYEVFIISVMETPHVRLFNLPRKQVCMSRSPVRQTDVRYVESIEAVDSVPVRCIQVDNESHLFLAGRGFIPTHNTAALVMGFASHVICNDPGDMLCVNMTQDKAREMSKVDIDRMIRHSPNVKALMGRSQDDNTHDKAFRHGMWMRIAWPTVSNMSGSTYRYVLLTDFDRMPDDIDGEGSAFGLALKRTQTFLSRGMCMVESSPGRDLTDPFWRPATLHEAPPCGGILGVYNRSDRRRFYWQCPDCSEFFEAAPGLGLFGLPEESTLIEIVRTVDIEELAKEHNRVTCPHCGVIHGPKAKHTMNASGLWVPDGQIVTAQRELVGDAISSPIAGYWLGGAAAAYQSWKSIISRYLLGLREYALSGSELSLINTTNTDQGMPYMPKAIAQEARGASTPEGRKDDTLDRFIVPDEARFLVAAVDIQGGQNARFVVQVNAVGQNLEQWPIDRFSIINSARQGESDHMMALDPAAYPEDWDMLTEMVVKSTYRLTEEGRELRIRKIAVDTGGEDGVTAQAYDWYRRLRREGEHVRVMLIKGASTKTAPIIKESLVGNKRPKEKGDVPLYMLNVNLLKDAVSAAMKRVSAGAGYIHIPGWLPTSWFEELNAEIRMKDGTWKKIKKRNETFDLMAYMRAACIALGADKFDWDHPPTWALPMHLNKDVITRDERKRMQQPVQGAPRARRVSRSSYLGR